MEAKALLRQQGITPSMVRKQATPVFGGDPKITPLDIAIVTRQIATMLAAGVPLVQAIDLISSGSEKKNLRVLVGTARCTPNALDFKRVRGGILAQERAPNVIDDSTWQVVTRRQPSADERTNMLFAWRAVASVKSNAIVLVRDGATIGIGAGQMSRVDAAFLSVHKARTAGHGTEGAVMGSDAFFPFRDSVDQAVEAGVKAIIQPGGSIRDADVVAAADEHGVAMVFTGQRQFRH